MARGFRGMRDDLAELARLLFDAACFLGPLLPPSADSPPPSPRPPRRRLRRPRPPEIANAFKAALSSLSSAGGFPGISSTDVAVSAAVGDEVVEFVRELAKTPESWLEFQMSQLDSGFVMTAPQREHAATMEDLVPNLATLKLDLCLKHMNEETFWRIYFALLHPKLNKKDAEFLSTLEIVESMGGMQKVLNSSGRQLETARTAMGDEGNNMPEEYDHAQDALTISNSAFQETTDQYLRTPSDTDASIVSRRHFKSEDDLLFSDREEGGGVIVPKCPSYGQGVHRVSSYSSDNWVKLRSRDQSSDTLSRTHELFQGQEPSDKEQSDWQDVEESDFEVMGNSS